MEYLRSTRFTHLPPLRPIVSQSASPLSASAIFIDHVLQPLALQYPDYLHNSTALSLLLEDLHIPDEAILVAIDVSSLYPSIPQTECLNIIRYTNIGTCLSLIPVLSHNSSTLTLIITTLLWDNLHSSKLMARQWVPLSHQQWLTSLCQQLSRASFAHNPSNLF